MSLRIWLGLKAYLSLESLQMKKRNDGHVSLAAESGDLDALIKQQANFGRRVTLKNS